MTNNKENKIIVVLDNVRSALNVGSVLRTADSLGIDEVWLCGITATPPSKEIHKSALGAEFSVKWRYFETTIDAINELKSDNTKIVAVEQAENSTDLREFKREENRIHAFVMGNEVEGVSPEVLALCDEVVEMKQHGIKKSMNVSVACGIVLWQVSL